MIINKVQKKTNKTLKKLKREKYTETPKEKHGSTMAPFMNINEQQHSLSGAIEQKMNELMVFS